MTTTAPHLESILRPTKLAIVLFAISNAGLVEYIGTGGGASLFEHGQEEERVPMSDVTFVDDTVLLLMADTPEGLMRKAEEN